MSLKVVVASATDVPNPETFGKCDPYATIEFKGQKKKTEVVKSELNPEWNQEFEFDLSSALSGTDELVASVWDWERVGRNRLLGTARVYLAQFTGGGGQTKTLEVNLVDGNQRPLQAVLKLTITYNPPAGASSGVAAMEDDKKEEEKKEEEKKEHRKEQKKGTVVETESTGGESEEGEDSQDGPPQLDASGKPMPRRAGKKKNKSSRRKGRKNLSDKVQDFQVSSAWTVPKTLFSLVWTQNPVQLLTTVYCFHVSECDNN